MPEDISLEESGMPAGGLTDSTTGDVFGQIQENVYPERANLDWILVLVNVTIAALFLFGGVLRLNGEARLQHCSTQTY